MPPTALRLAVLTMVLCLPLFSGCQEASTLLREIRNRVDKVYKTKTPFEQKDGLTIRTCWMYMTANENSEVIGRLPPETPVRLISKIGDYYRARTRDGREGYLKEKMVGGEEIIAKTQQLRKSIEGLTPQAEGITKSKANFRLEPKARSSRYSRGVSPSDRHHLNQHKSRIRLTIRQTMQRRMFGTR
jgi:hypothetical protein